MLVLLVGRDGRRLWLHTVRVLVLVLFNSAAVVVVRLSRLVRRHVHHVALDDHLDLAAAVVYDALHLLVRAIRQRHAVPLEYLVALVYLPHRLDHGRPMHLSDDGG